MKNGMDFKIFLTQTYIFILFSKNFLKYPQASNIHIQAMSVAYAYPTFWTMGKPERTGRQYLMCSESNPLIPEIPLLVFDSLVNYFFFSLIQLGAFIHSTFEK